MARDCGESGGERWAVNKMCQGLELEQGLI